MSKFPGAQTPFTTNLEFQSAFPLFKCFRVTDPLGNVIEPSFKNTIPDEKLIKMYETMVSLSVMDGIFYDAQRQGRVSFYMTSGGEEAVHVGSCAALKPEDELFCQYRETGVLMWRGFTLQQFADQCFSTDMDLGKGRQMPIHYGSRELHFQTISSTLTTQLPQAVGAAYAFKRDKEDRVSVCYFGEGAASEGDFHAALNFASTLKCPVIFVCRNNGYAISTSSKEQYNGDGIAVRGPAYGMRTVRVDGMDLLAVHGAFEQARALAVENSEPVLVECMSYRGGHHSTSDDSSRYRGKDEMLWWAENMNPLSRTRLYLEGKNLWDSDKESSFRHDKRTEILRCISTAETRTRPALSELFTDVYKEMPPNLKEQQAEMYAHLEKYPDKYPLHTFTPNDEYVKPDPIR